MAVRPAVEGLVKHQFMQGRFGAALNEAVMTLWTYKNAYPVAGARVSYEQGAILAWLSSHWKQVTTIDWAASEIRTWDFGVSPPAKYPSQFVVPVLKGTMGAQAVPLQIQAVIALRTQAVGSGVRNRLNGRVAHAGVISATADAITSPTLANLLAAYTNLLGRLNTAAHADSGNWSVVSFFNAGAPRVTPVVTPINHVLVRALPGVQRRRRPHADAYARGL